jgi:hypothetical protein
MAALITALDIFTSQQKGENGHIEYSWSNDIREKIAQFSFQLTRQNSNQNKLNELSTILSGMISFLSLQLSKNYDISIHNEAKDYLCILYKMIGHTRDITDGKGEYMLSYMMICTWYEFFPSLAIFALDTLVKFGDDKNTHQYGSWKDLKYFCQYCLDTTKRGNHELISRSIRLMNTQLKEDERLLNDGLEQSISLVAKWTPREKSKYGWLFERLAVDYFFEIFETSKDQNSRSRAVLKCKTQYRKLISNLNKKLDTVQIKQCSKQWANIDPSNQTSITMNRQKFAFLNKTKLGARRYEDPDRIDCAKKFEAFIKDAVEGKVNIKGKRVGMHDFTKSALQLLHDKEMHKQEIDLLNAQWSDNASMTPSLGKMIAMVDVSGSMSGDPLHAAVALGIRIAEKSMLGKRVMTFSAQPTWVNLEDCKTFSEMVSLVANANWGMNTNFESALKMILDAIVDKRMQPLDVEDMVLVILSDMQMDHATNEETPLSESIARKYHEAGMKIWGKPFKPPHILFWNLRSTSGFPCLSSTKNTSMMSGFSPALLNLFCEEGMLSLHTCTPWSILIKTLDNERYNMLKIKFDEVVL